MGIFNGIELKQLVCNDQFNPRWESYELNTLGPKEVRVQSQLTAAKHGTEHSELLGKAIYIESPYLGDKKIFDRSTVNKPDTSQWKSVGNTTVGLVIETGAEVEKINNKLKTTAPVLVKSFSGLLTDFATEQKATAILRGLRAVADFEYEFQMAGMNSKLGPEIETIFLMASENLQLTSARFVKEIALYDGEIKNFVPKNVLKMFKIKRKGKLL